MEFGSTPSDWFQLVHQLTGDPFTLAANSSCSYTANGFQASFSFFLFFKTQTFFFLSKFKVKNVHSMIFSYLSSSFFFFFNLTGEASLKDGITYQQMQVSFSERRERSQKASVQTCRWLFLHNFMLIQGSDKFSSVLKKESVTFV